ncbi:pca operon transcription factor PcaQ [Thalassobaculum fulvum]|uniref:pca operon transcription factor PcaQ n=1 Tax=Thalassobaculum fulvum TaxID=1633335 RepID=UPI001671EC7E|nr:pca operon transcription factor PcaQ [Thalassobaculum fulvum]
MSDRPVKFRHFRCFAEVARLGSVNRAAESLAITQPAASKTLRELEEILEVPLFERTRRGVKLTEQGMVFRRHADAVLNALRRGMESVDALRAAGGGFVTVGVLPTVAARLMPDSVRRFIEVQPAQTVRVISGTNPVLIERLRQGELDMVVGRLSNPELMAGLNFEYLYSERLSFVVRPGHPLLARQRAGGPDFAMAALRDHVVILPTPEMIIRPAVERLLAQHGLETLPRSVESVSNAFGRTFTRSTDAIWIISHGVVATDVEEGALAELAVDTGESRGPVGLTTRIDTVPTSAATMFMDTVRAVAERVRG